MLTTTQPKKKTLLQRIFGCACKHDWAFALGVSPGIITLEPRELCFRRACTKCGRREEIEHYQTIFDHEGVSYFAGPQWRQSEPNPK
jgi:hypothetical protein